MEGTAAWSEDIVYDALNTRYSWLRYTALAHPEWSLDWNHYIETYGSFLFWRFWSEYYSSRFDVNGQAQPDRSVIRSLFGLVDWRVRWPGLPGHAGDLRVCQPAGQASGTKFRDIMGFFGIWNALPAALVSGSSNSLYEEGANYPAGRTLEASLSARPRARPEPSHNRSTTCRSVLRVPGRPVGACRRHAATRVQPAAVVGQHRPVARPARTRHHVPCQWSPDRGHVTLNSSGDATIDVGFAGGTVQRILRVQTNASVRYDCSVQQDTTGASRWTTTIPSPSRLPCVPAPPHGRCVVSSLAASRGPAWRGRSRHDLWARPCACPPVRATQPGVNGSIAFVHSANGAWDIWTMTSTGTSQVASITRPTSNVLRRTRRGAPDWLTHRTGTGTTKSS